MCDLTASVEGQENQVVALVVMRSASGRSLLGEAAISSENLHRHLPDDDAAEAVRHAFADKGFTLGPLLGIAMSLSGSQSRFENAFGITLQQHPDGGWSISGKGSVRHETLPLERLPPPLAAHIDTIVFEHPLTPDDEESMSHAD